jgi:VanZ family protein
MPRIPIPALLARLARIGLVVAAVIAFVFAIMPAIPGPETYNDKVLHGGTFFVLACLASVGWRRSSIIVLFVALTAFGGLIEIVQGLDLLGRDADWHDLVADMVGAALGLILTRALTRPA